ncbi:3311_t:CDS:2 [Ambispora leptoticha]|uniref:3311_t:CDS:1 n=1 Tax=Ambispora leptoticha TaxID=144679 RepID=A0A9N9F2F4_9GLOM|nr:3311_t:CDS:2 [Ambispora leptoticha]
MDEKSYLQLARLRKNCAVSLAMIIHSNHLLTGLLQPYIEIRVVRYYWKSQWIRAEYSYLACHPKKSMARTTRKFIILRTFDVHEGNLYGCHFFYRTQSEIERRINQLWRSHNNSPILLKDPSLEYLPKPNIIANIQQIEPCCTSGNSR